MVAVVRLPASIALRHQSMRNNKRPRATTAAASSSSSANNKTAMQDDVLDPISPSVLTREEGLQSTYRTARPFPHCVIRDFCKPGFLGEFCSIEYVIVMYPKHELISFRSFYSPWGLVDFSNVLIIRLCLHSLLLSTCTYYIHSVKQTEGVLTELKHNTKVKFKETDLFRVYQSIDLVSVCNSPGVGVLLILCRVCLN